MIPLTDEASCARSKVKGQAAITDRKVPGGQQVVLGGVHNYMDLLRPYVWCSVSNWGEVAVSTPQTFY